MLVLQDINKSCQRVCFECFFKELKRVCDERNNLENRVSNLERVVYEQGKSSHSQGNYLNNSEAAMALVDNAQNIIINQEQIRKNQKILKRRTEPQNLVKAIEKLKEKINSFLAGKHYLKLTQKQKKKIRERRKVFPHYKQEAVENNIYLFNSWKHYVGWPTFLILGAVAIKWIRKIIRKKPKPATNIQEEVQEKFNLWRLNMLLSVVVYIVFFFLTKDAIDKWLRPNIHRLIEKNENITVAVVAGILGFLFLADGYISSEVKTPLQRLSVKIESADLSEKEKKSLLLKTQQSNETF